MALVFNDRVKETSVTTGTGTLTLDGAVQGFETFSSAIGNSNTTYYAIELPGTTEFEVGRGTVSAGQLARTEIISSSNSDSAVDFSAGTKIVFCTLPASKAVIKDASNNVTLPADLTVDTDTLYVDSTNNRVGINAGTSLTTPGLEIGGNGSTDGRFTVSASDGSTWFEVGNGSGIVRFNSQGGRTLVGAANDLGARMNIGQLSASSAALALAGGFANNILEVNSANSNLGGDLMVINQNGLVGIGTSSPSTLLHLSSSDPQITITDTDGSGSQVIKAVTDNLEIDSASALILDGDQQIMFNDGGTNYGAFVYSAGGNKWTIHSQISDVDFVINGNDGGVQFDALTLDMSEAGAATFNDKVILGANKVIEFGDSGETISGDGTDLTVASSRHIKLDATNDITLDAGAGGIKFDDDGTTVGLLFNSSGDLTFKTVQQDKNLFIKGNDGGSEITALTLDMSAAGAATFNSTVTANAGVIVDNITIDGNEIDLSSGDFTLDVPGNINLDADSGSIFVRDAGTVIVKMGNDGSQNAQFKSNVSDKDILFKGNDGPSEITALTLDMSEAGDAIFNSNIFLGDNKKANFGAGNDLQIYHDGSQSIIEDAGTGQLKILAENTLFFGSTTGSEKYISAVKNGSVDLSHDNAVKLETTSTGIDVTGTAVTDGLTVAGNVSVDSGTIKLDGNYPTGTDNLALGDTALDSVTSGDQNTAIGSIALTALTTASFNTAIGYKALEDNISGTKNTAIGSNAASNTTGANNVAIGVRTLFFNTSGGKNTAVGEEALLNGTSASQNTALGYQAGTTVSGGSNLTILGYQAEPSSGSATNEITLGNSSVTSLRIPGLQSGASSGDVLTFDGTDIGFATPTGVSAGFAVAMAIAL